MNGLILILIIGLAAVAAGLGYIIFLLLKKKEGQPSDSLLMLQQQLNQISQVIDSKLSESNRTLQTQFGQSAKIIQDVTEKLTKLDETNRQVMNYSEQLQSLQDILKNPKHRGILGEYYLETLLRNVMPPGQYQMQYAFKNGEVVDAVIFVKDKIIPVDSKFSLENYNKLVEEKNPAERERLEKAFVGDLKIRIQETAKYVRPEENTLEFAFMFIPHEAIYYDLLVNKIGAITEETDNLIQRAASKYKVIIVSPTSFLAYLQTVLQGLKAMQIEESAKEIRKNVEALQKHIFAYDEYLQKVGNHLSTTVNAYNTAAKEFKKIDKDVLKIAGGESSIEVSLIDKPASEE